MDPVGIVMKGALEKLVENRTEDDWYQERASFLSTNQCLIHRLVR
jgi:hypothetical protein